MLVTLRAPKQVGSAHAASAAHWDDAELRAFYKAFHAHGPNWEQVSTCSDAVASCMSCLSAVAFCRCKFETTRTACAAGLQVAADVGGSKSMQECEALHSSYQTFLGLPHSPQLEDAFSAMVVDIQRAAAAAAVRHEPSGSQKQPGEDGMDEAADMNVDSVSDIKAEGSRGGASGNAAVTRAPRTAARRKRGMSQTSESTPSASDRQRRARQQRQQRAAEDHDGEGHEEHDNDEGAATGRDADDEEEGGEEDGEDEGGASPSTADASEGRWQAGARKRRAAAGHGAEAAAAADGGSLAASRPKRARRMRKLFGESSSDDEAERRRQLRQQRQQQRQHDWRADSRRHDHIWGECRGCGCSTVSCKKAWSIQAGLRRARQYSSFTVR